MALQGTLDTFALADVLRLLATTSKTGQLQVQGVQGDGRIDIDAGSVVGGSTSLAETSEADEVLFELLRMDDGSFVFDQDTPPGAGGNPRDVEDVIAAAESAHREWQDLSTVVPSLEVGLVLVEDLPVESTTIDRERWKLVVAIGGGTTVRALGAHLGLAELPVLRATRALVDDGLAEIDENLTAEPAASFAPVSADDPLGSSLPSLGDEPDDGDLFGFEDRGDAALPEPLLGGSELLPDEAARLEAQLDGLAPEHRDLVERAAEAGDSAVAEQLLAELPEGAIDQELMRRFLGSVRS